MSRDRLATALAVDYRTDMTSGMPPSIPPVQTSTPDRTGQATAGLVLGAVSLLAWCIPILGLPISIVGIVFSSLGMKSSKRGLALAGLIMSIVGLLGSIVNAVLGAAMAVAAMNQ